MDIKEWPPELKRMIVAVVTNKMELCMHDRIMELVPPDMKDSKFHRVFMNRANATILDIDEDIKNLCHQSGINYRAVIGVIDQVYQQAVCGDSAYQQHSEISKSLH